MSSKGGANNSGISLVKSDGVVVGGYSHSILRPFDSVRVPRDIKYSDGTTKQCEWPLFAGSKYQKWCNENDAVKYHAMRPIVNPDTYNGWLQSLFDYLKDPDHEVSSLLQEDLGSPNVFCDNQGEVTKWLMERIDEAVHKLPQMQHNGPWKYEQFYNTDMQFYSFMTKSHKIYKMIFNLYNTLRSVSTLIDCVITESPNGTRKIIKMDFVSTSGEWGFEGYNVGTTPKYGPGTVTGIKDVGFDWNYMNTLETQQFNNVGFYDPLRNITIEGGVPESLRNQIKACNGSILMKPVTVNVMGVDSLSGKPVSPSLGTPQMVMANSGVTYKDGKASIVYY